MRLKLISATLAMAFLCCVVISAAIITLAQSGLTLHAGLDVSCGGNTHDNVRADAAPLADSAGEYDPFDNSPAAIASRISTYGTDD